MDALGSGGEGEGEGMTREGLSRGAPDGERRWAAEGEGGGNLCMVPRQDGGTGSVTNVARTVAQLLLRSFSRRSIMA